MIYILLPVHNRVKVTEQFIKSLVSQTYKKFTLVLIDDGSSDDTDKMVKSYLPNSIILKGDGNLWWAGSLQKGFKWIKDNIGTGYILIINDDTVIPNNYLDTGKSLIDKNNKCLIGSLAYDKNNKLIDSGVNVDWEKLIFNQAKSNEDINCLSTRGLFLKVSDFLNINGFYPKILPHYFSDYEFTIRARRKGYRLITDSSLYLNFNTETTGYNIIKKDKLYNYINKILSKRNHNNPFYYVNFIFLSSPKKYILINILRIYLKCFKNMLNNK